MRLAFNRGEKARLIAGKGRQTHRITLAQRYIAQQQAGVKSMVEVREVAVLAAHASATVEQKDNLLVAFVLVFAGNWRAFARGGFPVDLAQGVAVAKFAQLLEFLTQATPLLLTHAKLAEPVVYAFKAGVIQAGEVRIDTGRAR